MKCKYITPHFIYYLSYFSNLKKKKKITITTMLLTDLYFYLEMTMKKQTLLYSLNQA